MNLAEFSQALEETVKGVDSLRGALRAVAAFIGSHFLCDRVYLCILDDTHFYSVQWGEGLSSEDAASSYFTLLENAIETKGRTVSLPIFVNDLERCAQKELPLDELRVVGTCSFALYPIYFASKIVGYVEIHHRKDAHTWRREDQKILSIFALRLPFLFKGLLGTAAERKSADDADKPKKAQPLGPGDVYYEKLTEVQLAYKRLLEYGNFVLFKADPDFVVMDVRGDPDPLLGIEASALVKSADALAKFLPVKDRLRFAQKIRAAKKSHSELHDELKVVHFKTKEERWILLRAVPLFSGEREFLGWEALAVDITDKKKAEEGLLHEKRRLQALYDLASSARASNEPEILAWKTLKILRSATKASCGFIVFVGPGTRACELVAVEGLSESEVNQLGSVINHSKFLHNIMETRKGAMVGDVVEEIEENDALRKSHCVRTLITVPLVSNEVMLGFLCLGRRSPNSLSAEDFELVQVASSHIGLGLREAEFRMSERRSTDALALLYRVSHELSKYLTPREVTEHAVLVLSEELPAKRIWIGVMNEQRTHIAGQAGFGPGLRKQLVNIQLEMDLRHEHIDEAIQLKKPIVVQPGQSMECSGLEELISKLALQTFAILPLVSLGQVIGLMIFEPTKGDLFFAEGKLPLLVNVSTEIATILLARRFEAKMADAEKMKMAGLLASGVSHNFNNLLQAVMGHASLIQMQATPGSRIADSARRIVDASGKGASLVNQLMTVSSKNSFSRKSLSVNKVFQESRDFYKSVLGPEIFLEMDLEDEVPNILADYSQVQQVMTNLLLNAKDSLNGRLDGLVKLQTRRVRIKSGEVSNDLAPGAYVRIDVQDNGQGMDEEIQARCFEPFFTTKGRDPDSGVGVGGSGLGLSSSYSILRQHSGHISVKSQVSAGSMFSMFIPLVSIGAEDGQFAGHGEAIEAGKADLIIVSLDEIVISAVKLSIESFGLSGQTSSSYQEAEAIINGEEAFGGLLVLDLDDPELRFSKLSAITRKSKSLVRAILLTKEPSKWERVIRGFEHVQVVKKPIGAWSLHTAISKLLDIQTSQSLKGQVEVEVSSEEMNNGQKPKKTRSGRVKVKEEKLEESGETES